MDTFTIYDDCYPLEGPDFYVFVAVVMIGIAPFAAGYILWRIFVINRTSPVGTILRLDENSAPYTEDYDREIPWQTRFLYGLTGLVFCFEVFRYLMDLLST